MLAGLAPNRDAALPVAGVADELALPNIDAGFGASLAAGLFVSAGLAPNDEAGGAVSKGLFCEPKRPDAAFVSAGCSSGFASSFGAVAPPNKLDVDFRASVVAGLAVKGDEPKRGWLV